MVLGIPARNELVASALGDFCGSEASRSMHHLIRIVLLTILALVSSSRMSPGQQAAGSAPKMNPAPTPIPLAEVPSQAQSALDTLQEIEADVSREQSSADAISSSVLDLNGEIDARIADDKRLLTTSPSLDVLYRLKRNWQTFGVRSLVSARELTGHATSLEEQLGRLDKLNKTWQATLQAAKQPGTPAPVLQRVQSVVDSIARTRQAIESSQAHVLALQSGLSEAQARVRTALSLIDQAEIQALQHIFVRDSPPSGRLRQVWGQSGRGRAASRFLYNWKHPLRSPNDSHSPS